MPQIKPQKKKADKNGYTIDLININTKYANARKALNKDGFNANNFGLLRLQSTEKVEESEEQGKDDLIVRILADALQGKHQEGSSEQPSMVLSPQNTAYHEPLMQHPNSRMNSQFSIRPNVHISYDSQ